MTLVPVPYPTHSRTNSGKTGVQRRSSLLEPKKKQSSCYCVKDVDFDIYRGAFCEQWLHGEKFGTCEMQFFCTTCGPQSVQELQKNGTASSPTAARGGGAEGSKLKSTFSNLSLSADGSVAPMSTADSSATPTAAPSTPGAGKQGSSIAKIKKFFSLSSSKKESSTLSKEVKRLPAEEEELPITPRTERELFLCATCGACYCRDHACDHHFSRRTSAGLAPAVLSVSVSSNNLCSNATNLHNVSIGSAEGNHYFASNGNGSMSCSAERTYPYHSIFIGVTSYVSTHPGHAMQETSWGVLFPTVTVKEIQDGTANLSREMPFYSNFERICDEGISLSSSPSSPAGNIRSSENPTGMSGQPSSPRSPTYPQQQQLPAGTVLSPPQFHCTPPDNWSYLIWCAGCSDRPVRVNGRHYDSDSSRQRHVRRLGQLTAFLLYCRRTGLRLQLPSKYMDYVERKQLAQQAFHQQRTLQRNASAAELARSNKICESTVGETQVVPNTPMSPATNNSRSVTRIETDRVMTTARIAGFSNSSYFCYFNSVMQCTLRCNFFCKPLVSIGVANRPGKLTLSMCNLIHHLRRQTYQDVRNGAVNAYARAVHQRICKLCPMFEEDEQQDAQELLLCLVNGVADEFDKGKSAEEKKTMKRISFEGVMETAVVCCRCHHRVPREEMFMSLSIPIEGSIEKGIKSFFQPAFLKDKDRYACEHCFKKLNTQEQELHNAVAREQQVERKKNKTSRHKIPAAEEAETKMENCLYQDAEVHTSITRLGDTLAVHLLRFHYDEEAQDFIKVTTPVDISLKIDLSPFVSDDVLQQYARDRSQRVLTARFRSIDKSTLDEYLQKSRYDYTAASKQLQVDGHSMTHSRVNSVDVSRGSARLSPSGEKSAFDNAAGAAAAPPPPGSPNQATTSSSVDPVPNWTAGQPATPLSTKISREDEYDAFGERNTRTPSLQRQLIGIVAHRGSLHAGHYIAYVRHLTRPDVWFRCDDDDVDIVDEKVVLDCSAEVYLAFYE